MELRSFGRAFSASHKIEVFKFFGEKFGEVAEWLKAHAWKVCDAREGVRGFESLLLRFL